MPDEATVKPGGLSFIRMEYTDHNGIWKPMERHSLSVTVNNGSLVGLGNACPYKKGSFGGNTTETYFGDALAVVRADGSGDMTVTVTDEKTEYSVTISCMEERK
jgi:beta-galactosidase